MACNCTRLFGFILLCAGAVACAISFIAPYWVTMGNENKGLLGKCYGDVKANVRDTIENQCRWFPYNDFDYYKNKSEDWFFGSLALFAFGMILLVIAVPCACASLCCCSHGRMARTTGSLALFAGILIAISLIIYAVFMSQEEANKPIPFVNQDNAYHYSWAYYCGIGGVLVVWIASGIFLCTRVKNYD